ncbi:MULTISPECIES: MBL fold metallo-hydrolase [Bacillus cereus group]|uniref:MBL fold metallo-hydrolase n=1 Tax=Bacillus cereus group TaxID=86661 RepID=UPI000B432E93|nr:MBL fold metallo-hydrolase [Bacillus thuringiensis]ARZ62373.1 MBL fold metallo-hydrolase [Bacillus thuringiensis]
MNTIQVTMFEAGNGDSFLIKCIGENLTNILVDFGYSYTYKKHTEKYLKSMATNNQKIDLAIVTHIDQDHISGGIRFFEDNGFADAPNIISVGEVWHNSYRHLDMIETDKLLTEKERKHIARHSLVVEQNRDGNETDTSGKQGSRLAANLKHYGYNWNGSFNGNAILNKQESIFFNDEVKITVLSPTNKELETLKKTWKKELKIKFPTIALNNDTIFDDAVECISLMRRPSNVSNSLRDASATINLESLANTVFQEDDDEINASSITCIIEFNDKKILMLGDSVPSIVEDQLKKIYGEEDFPIYFDAIKVSHHGSVKNTSSELLNIIDSEHYFISTNGKNYGHPDIETIAKIIVRKDSEKFRNIYITNKQSKLDVFENEEWQRKYQYKIHYRSITKDNLQIYL